MARPNYSYQKRAKELAKKKKKEEKKQRKLERKNLLAREGETQVSNGNPVQGPDENTPPA